MSPCSPFRSSKQCPELVGSSCWRESPSTSINLPSTENIKATFPVIDGDFITESPTLQLQAGKFVKVPLLIGANHDEGTAFGIRGVNTTAEFVAYLQEYVPDNTSVAILSALYPDIPEIGIPGTFQGRPGGDLGLMYKRASGMWTLFSSLLIHLFSAIKNLWPSTNNLSPLQL